MSPAVEEIRQALNVLFEPRSAVEGRPSRSADQVQVRQICSVQASRVWRHPQLQGLA